MQLLNFNTCRFLLKALKLALAKPYLFKIANYYAHNNSTHVGLRYTCRPKVHMYMCRLHIHVTASLSTLSSSNFLPSLYPPYVLFMHTHIHTYTHTNTHTHTHSTLTSLLCISCQQEQFLVDTGAHMNHCI